MIEIATLTALARLLRPWETAISITGTVSSATTVSVTSSDITGVDSSLARHCILEFTSGALNGQKRIIWSSTSGQVTWGWPTNVASSNGDTFTLKSAPLSSCNIYLFDQHLTAGSFGIFIIPRKTSFRQAIGKGGGWGSNHAITPVEILCETDWDLIHTPSGQLNEYYELYNLAPQVAGVLRTNRTFAAEAGGAKNVQINVPQPGDSPQDIGYDYIAYPRDRDKKIADSFVISLLYAV